MSRRSGKKCFSLAAAAPAPAAATTTTIIIKCMVWGTVSFSN